MGSGSHRPALLAWTNMGFWSSLYQREHSNHGLSVHHLQCLPGNVHFHLPLCSAEEGNNERIVLEEKPNEYLLFKKKGGVDE